MRDHENNHNLISFLITRLPRVKHGKILQAYWASAPVVVLHTPFANIIQKIFYHSNVTTIGVVLIPFRSFNKWKPVRKRKRLRQHLYHHPVCSMLMLASCYINHNTLNHLTHIYGFQSEFISVCLNQKQIPKTP